MRFGSSSCSAIVSLTFLVSYTSALKTGDWKTCSQSGFCRRGRALSARAQAASSWESPYSVDASSIALASDQAAFTAAITSSIYPAIKFGLEVRVHEDGVVRVRMDDAHVLGAYRQRLGDDLRHRGVGALPHIDRRNGEARRAVAIHRNDCDRCGGTS